MHPAACFARAVHAGLGRGALISAVSQKLCGTHCRLRQLPVYCVTAYELWRLQSISECPQAGACADTLLSHTGGEQVSWTVM